MDIKFKKKDKNLLLQDLCSRLLYGVRCSFGVDDAIYEITGLNLSKKELDDKGSTQKKIKRYD